MKACLLSSFVESFMNHCWYTLAINTLGWFYFQVLLGSWFTRCGQCCSIGCWTSDTLCNCCTQWSLAMGIPQKSHQNFNSKLVVTCNILCVYNCSFHDTRTVAYWVKVFCNHTGRSLTLIWHGRSIPSPRRLHFFPCANLIWPPFFVLNLKWIYMSWIGLDITTFTI